MRTIVDLPDAQVQALARVCRQEKISRAEAVRRAVAGWVSASTPAPAAGFGLWSHKKKNARKQVDRLRAEWERP